MTESVIPFGEWLPDQPAIGNPGLITATNVVPLTAESYGPMAAMANIASAMTGAATGFYSVIDQAGTPEEFAGDTTKLYVKASSGSTWNDATGASGPYTPSSGAGFWTITAFGSRVIATNGYDPMQTYLIGTDTTFSDLGGGAPKARYGAVIRDFYMAAFVTDTFAPYRVQWCAIGDPTNWPTPGTDAAIQLQSDYQDLQQADLGLITGIFGGGFGGTDGAVWCQRGIYRIAYVGNPAIFEFAPAAGAPGSLWPRSIVRVPVSNSRGGGAYGFYLAQDGFQVFDGTASTSIGADKFDRAFFAEANASYLSEVQGAADPEHKLVLWAFKSGTSSSRYNRLLVYNWELNRGALCDLTDAPFEWICNRDNGSNILKLGGFDSSHRLASFSGSNMAPELVTGDRQLFPGRRSRIQSVRPIHDGGTASVAVAARALPTGAVSYQAAVPVNVLGECPQRVSGRYARFKLTLPAASSFTHLQGLEVTAAPEGKRR